ncbi:tyrosine-type recombinase/integrase [Intrasporangium calvum]|uniref:Integrase family protein n=1 Tax=Intrasporangium calvum (strain ATCC 23552 / DSM 43043 / JCM 3097 / NBRC 12989 / NCIMB 10167 / NRRL B-3866 / 7 KIP) TaxID=710696 RepID=E6SAZ6_INTC7|nr:site-specific integrase [Intrasporangium calvum]ADU49457.1 integrase family protein [Intrasporangium calvum DSM 43043]
MASVSRNPKDPGWQARWRDPGGRQRKKNFTRKVDAQRWLDQMQAERHRGQYVDPRAGKVRVSEVAEGWARGLTHLKVSTATRYRGLMCGHILPRFGAWAVADLRHSDVRDWVNDLSASGLSAGTVRQAHRVLSLILSESVKDGRIARNVAAGVQLPRAVRADPRFLDADEVARLIAGAGTNGLSIAVLAFCGLRFGELAALRVRRANVLRRRLVVAESVTEVGGRLVWSLPKTNRTRTVPFPPSLTPQIEALCRGKGPDDLLFTAPEGGALRLGNWRRRVFDPACRAAGLVGVTPHDLRHTAASLAIASGANVKAVQQMLGHASAAMTLDVYAGLFGDDLDAVALALDGLVPPLRPLRVQSDGEEGQADAADPA